MRTILIVSVMLLSTTAARAETTLASVNGMVCAFCATGIEKSFRKQPAVDKVKVDLESKVVTVETKANQTLGDDIVKSVIAEAGYTVTGIERKQTP